MKWGCEEYTVYLYGFRKFPFFVQIPAFTSSFLASDVDTLAVYLFISAMYFLVSLSVMNTSKSPSLYHSAALEQGNSRLSHRTTGNSEIRSVVHP